MRKLIVGFALLCSFALFGSNLATKAKIGGCLLVLYFVMKGARKRGSSQTATPDKASALNQNTFEDVLKNGLIEPIRELISTGFDFNHGVKGADTRFFMVVRSNQLEIFKEVLSNAKPKIDINLRGSNDLTALMVASALGNAEIVKILIENGAGVEMTETHGYSPVCFAASGGKIDCLRVLLEKGTSSNGSERLAEDETPIHMALKDGHVECAKLLIKYGARMSGLTRSQYESVCAGTLAEWTELFDFVREIERGNRIRVESYSLTNPFFNNRVVSDIQCLVVVGVRCGEVFKANELDGTKGYELHRELLSDLGPDFVGTIIKEKIHAFIVQFFPMVFMFNKRHVAAFAYQDSSMLNNIGHVMDIAALGSRSSWQKVREMVERRSVSWSPDHSSEDIDIVHERFCREEGLKFKDSEEILATIFTNQSHSSSSRREANGNDSESEEESFNGDSEIHSEDFDEGDGKESTGDDVSEFDFDPYAVLCIKRGSSQKEIRDAYIAQVKSYHPDRVAQLGPDLQKLAEEKLKQINAAYEMLKQAA